MEAEIEQKIEETVLEILKSSDLNETTLSMVLNMATAKLTLDLSQPDRKQFVKQVVYTFLADKLSKAKCESDQLTKEEPESDQLTKDEPEPDQLTNAEPEPDQDNNSAKQADEEPEEENEEEQKRKRGDSEECDDNGDLIICKPISPIFQPETDQLTKAEPEPDKDNSIAKQAKEEPEEENEEERKRKRGNSKEYDDSGDLIICELSERRRVTIQDYRLKTLVSIREYYRRDSKGITNQKTIPGISLTAEEWSAFKNNVPAIEKAIKNMESRLN